ncbi:MAG: HNH endonuclease [Deltaproteobacteria bacterium]|nr:HNH endonuclease [Deltaproteobacteria bacterium]
MLNVLLLNADYTPMRVIRWERAVELVLDQKLVQVAAYPGRFVRSMALALPWPSVVALRKYSHGRGKVRFSSRNVQARDAYTCSYCGVRPRQADGRPDRVSLTLDHVIPRAHAREGKVYLPWSRKWVNVSCWENSATACRNCNSRKADRTPVQANMTLRIYPRVPTQADALRMAMSRLMVVPEEWLPWLPPDVLEAEEVRVPTRARGAG